MGPFWRVQQMFRARIRVAHAVPLVSLIMESAWVAVRFFIFIKYAATIAEDLWGKYVSLQN